MLSGTTKYSTYELTTTYQQRKLCSLERICSKLSPCTWNKNISAVQWKERQLDFLTVKWIRRAISWLSSIKIAEILPPSIYLWNFLDMKVSSLYDELTNGNNYWIKSFYHMNILSMCYQKLWINARVYKCGNYHLYVMQLLSRILFVNLERQLASFLWQHSRTIV